MAGDLKPCLKPCQWTALDILNIIWQHGTEPDRNFRKMAAGKSLKGQSNDLAAWQAAASFTWSVCNKMLLLIAAFYFLLKEAAEFMSRSGGSHHIAVHMMSFEQPSASYISFLY